MMCGFRIFPCGCLSYDSYGCIQFKINKLVFLGYPFISIRGTEHFQRAAMGMGMTPWVPEVRILVSISVALGSWQCPGCSPVILVVIWWFVYICKCLYRPCPFSPGFLIDISDFEFSVIALVNTHQRHDARHRGTHTESYHRREHGLRKKGIAQFGQQTIADMSTCGGHSTL